MRRCQRVNKVISLDKRAEDEEKPFLEQLLQEGARKLLQAAIENEVINYIEFHKDRRGKNGQRLAVRNGHINYCESASVINVNYVSHGAWMQERQQLSMRNARMQ
jgi:hypothetical protein